MVGDTSHLDLEELSVLSAVDQVIRISHEFRILDRHSEVSASLDFEYNKVRFNQDYLHIFAGLCAVDNRRTVETMMAALQKY